MPSSDRLQRREEQEGPESGRDVPAPAPVPFVASALAVQRTAGNRALQRLIYGTKSGKLTVPSELGNQLFPWNSETKAWDTPQAEPSGVKKTKRGAAPKGRTATKAKRAVTDEQPDAQPETTTDEPAVPKERTYATLINTDAVFREHIRKGMALERLTSMSSMTSVELDAAVDEHLIGEEPAEGTAAEVKAVAQHHRQLLHHEPGTKYTKKDQVKPAWMVTDPYALIAGKPDLGKATDDLLTTDIPGRPGAKQWTYACVLIALAKLDDDYRTTKEITKADPKRIEDAVQALHKHYVEGDVQYDDSATRFSIMKRWGYTPVWVGKSPWSSLPSQVALPANQTYIFDIDGHTLVVKTKQAIKRGAANITRYRDFFDTWSDSRNWNDEMTFGKPVLNIWKKN